MSATVDTRIRGRFWCALSAVLLLAVWLVPSASAAAAPIRILSPAPQALVTGKRLVVRMRGERGVAGLRLRVAGHEAKAKPAAGGDGVRVAAVPLRALPHGRLTVLVKGLLHGHAVSSARTIVVGRRTKHLLRYVKLPHRATGAARLRVRLGGEISAFAVKVDGRRAHVLRLPEEPASYTKGATPFGAGGRRPVIKWLPAKPTTIPLSADDGLRPGRNRVTVLAYRAKTGRWDRASRTIWITRRRPLVAAGQDRKVTAGDSVRLDGTDSRPAHPGGTLRYNWRIVSQPRAPRREPTARLIDPHAVRPRLVTRRPGTYKVALHLVETGTRPRARRARASASAVSSAPVDVLTLEAGEPAWPWGYRMDSEPTGTGGWQTWIEEAPITGGENWSFDSGPGELQVVVLDRSNLTVTSETSYPDSEGNCEAAAKAGETSKPSELVIVAGYCPAEGGEAKGFTTIYGGGRQQETNAGYQIGFGAGGISGVFRRSISLSGSAYYGFVDTQTPTFDTDEEVNGTAYTNVAGRRTPIELEGAKAGIVITALNPALERLPSLSATFPIGETEGDDNSLGRAAELLTEIAEKDLGGVMLLQTVGDPHPVSLGGRGGTYAPWLKLGALLTDFGGTPAVWDELSGTGNYALVGTVYGAGEKQELRQASTTEESAPPGDTEAPAWAGTAKGVFGRGTNSLPTIRASDPGPKANPGELTILAEAEPQAWPLSDAAHEAALAWISEELKLGDPKGDHNGWCFVPQVWDVRAVYCNRLLHEQWGTTYLTELKGLQCAKAGSEHFDTEQCEEEVAQLAKEFGDIGVVYALVRELKETFLQNQLATGELLKVAVEKLESETKTEPPDSENPIPVWAVGIVDGVATVIQDIEWTQPEVSIGAGILEATINTGLDYAETDDGQSAAAPFTVSDRWQVSSEVVERLRDAVVGVEKLEDLFLTDWQKMSTVAENAVAVWGINSEAIGEQSAHFKAGSERWLYETIVPATYHLISVPMVPGAANLTSLHEFTCDWEEETFRGPEEWKWKPFKGVAEGGAFFAPTEGSAAVIGNLDGGEYPTIPTESLTEDLFRPVASGGAGLTPAPFFTWGWYGQEQSLQALIKEGKMKAGRHSPEKCVPAS